MFAYNETSSLIQSTQESKGLEKENYNDVEHGKSTSLRSDSCVRENLNDNIEISCMELFRNEFRSSVFFSLLDVNGNVIDVQSAFTPKPLCWTVLIRMVFTGFILINTIHDIQNTQWLAMWFGYLTNLSVMMTLMYQIPSLICSIFPNSLIIQPKYEQDGKNQEGPSFLICYLWAMFTTAMTAETSATIMYWTLVYNPKTGHNDIYRISMFHGVVAALLYIDGFMISKIPIRLKHFIFPFVFGLLYVIWNMIQSLSGIGTRKGRHNGVPLYPILNWKHDFQTTCTISVLLLIVIVPFIYLFLWFSSIVSCTCKCNGSSRRYLKSSRNAAN